jgi:UDP-N-acetylglucosamine diphosphorylase / glucose-1-phosphate thymidylyltransferase / UDP-N-acetylgalactosamine diphosphorylase / glucosamine-1-phosphate N-acetyltransferase / galactosamine-1-phosphate N-acetyltransferase
VSTTRLVLFDDERAAGWWPFALTRPAGELVFGCLTFRERAETVTGLRCEGHLCGGRLHGFDEPWARPVLAAAPADRRPALFLCGRALLEPGRFREPDRSGVVQVGGRTAGWFSADGTPPPDRVLAFLEADGPVVAAFDGRLLDDVWELVGGNTERLRADIEAARNVDAAALPDGVHALGEPLLRLGSGAVVEPGVVLDFSDGPIWFDAGVRVRAFSRIAGPLYAGRDSTLLGGSYTAATIGAHCKVRGEVEESVILGHSNKAHDGFLGHAYLGRWVNLGAMTTNSDLKNNYGTIRIATPAGDRDTGLIKLGCLIGDHVKTGIGVLLNTGTVIGAASNLFGAVLPPKHVPPFSWGSGSDLVSYDVEKFLATAEIVMKRRGVDLSDGQRDLLRQAAAQHEEHGAGRG